MANTRFETFSFLPPMSPNQVRLQAENILNQGCIPFIEFADDPRPDETYWNLWPIPETREVTSTTIVSQVDSCARRNPYALIKLSGYDTTKKMYTTSFIVKTPLDAA